MASSIFSSKAIGFRWGNDEIWYDFGTFRFKKPTAMDFHLNSCVLPGLESFPSQSLLTKRIAGWIWYILGVSVNGVFWHQTSFEIWQILANTMIHRQTWWVFPKSSDIKPFTWWCYCTFTNHALNHRTPWRIFNILHQRFFLGMTTLAVSWHEGFTPSMGFSWDN